LQRLRACPELVAGLTRLITPTHHPHYLPDLVVLRKQTFFVLDKQELV